MSAPLIDPSASATHGVTSSTASTPNFVGTCGRRDRGDDAPGGEAERHGNAGAAPRRQHDLPAPPGLDIAPALEPVEHKPRQEPDRERRRRWSRPARP